MRASDGLASLPEQLKKMLRGTRLLEHLSGFRCQRVSFSWCGEDIFLRSFYDRLAQERGITVANGCAVDVGAFRPIALSNTYYFYKRGWHCINIDPTPGSKRIFDKVRPRDTNLQLAVSQTDGQGYFYMVGQQPSVWNTLDRDAAASVAQKTGMEAKTVVIEQRRLETILDCHLKGRTFELLAIDAEGYDIEILKSNNFARFAPRVILIEVFLPSLEAIAASEVYAYLTRAGYTLYSWLNPNLMFVRNDSLDWQDASQIQLLPAGQLA